MRVENPGDVLEDIATSLKTKFKKLTELESKAKKGERWSKKEVLGHLIDSALINHQRIVRASFTGNLVFDGYRQDDWVAAHLYQDMSWKDLIETWYRYNTHLAFYLKRLPNEILYQETKDHNLDEIGHNRVKKEESTTLAYLVWDYIAHMEHHAKQIIAFYKPQVIEPY